MRLLAEPLCPCHGGLLAAWSVQVTVPRFVIDERDVDFRALTLTLTAEEAHHARTVLRLRKGDRVEALDGRRVYEGTVSEVRKDTVAIALSSWRDAQVAAARLVLYQAIPKGKKAEFIAEKATEVGVDEIVFFSAERSYADISPARLERVRRHAKEAVRQCGRDTIPLVTVLSEPGVDAVFERHLREDVPGSEADGSSIRAGHDATGVARLHGQAESEAILAGPISQASSATPGSSAGVGVEPTEAAGVQTSTLLVLDPGGEPLRDVFADATVASSRTLALVVGPEGGFSDEEIEAFVARGARLVSLDTYVLRTETTALVACAVARHELARARERAGQETTSAVPKRTEEG
jgi:16S rRNA (uracil1498-N3)-methyltransferase